MTRTAAASAIAALLLFASTAVATPQTARGLGTMAEVELLAEGDAFHRGMRPMEALSRFEEVLALEPDHYEGLWKSARESVSLGMLAPSENARRSRYREAEDFARRAIEVDGEKSEGHLWLSISLGRQALEEGLRSRVSIALEMREAALAALDLDPESPGAHHVLGQWHAEVMRASGLSRFIARRVFGGEDLDHASWESAEEHLLQAVRLAPETLIHQLELGRVYLDTGRPDEARTRFREVLERPSLEPTDPLHKQRAQELLKRLS